MPDPSEKIKLLEDVLSYWKGHLSVHDVLASELAYSLIFDNVRPDRVAEAMSTVGLSELPNRFFSFKSTITTIMPISCALRRNFFRKLLY